MEPDFRASDEFDRRIDQHSDKLKALGAAGVAAMGALAKGVSDVVSEMGKLNEATESSIRINLGAAADGIDTLGESYRIAKESLLDLVQTQQLMASLSDQPGITAANVIATTEAAAQFAGIAQVAPTEAAQLIASGMQGTGMDAQELVRISTALAGRNAESLIDAFLGESTHFQASGFDATQALQLFRLARETTGQNYGELGSMIGTIFETVREPDRLLQGSYALQEAAQNRDLAAFISAGAAMSEQQRADVFGEASSLIGALGSVESLDLQAAQLQEQRRIASILEEQAVTNREQARLVEQQYNDANLPNTFAGSLYMQGQDLAADAAQRLGPLEGATRAGGSTLLDAAGGIAGPVVGSVLASRFFGRGGQAAGRAATQAAGRVAASGAARRSLGSIISGQFLRGGARGIAARGLGRMIPGLGWGLLGLDAAQILGTVAEDRGWIDPGVLPRWLGGSGGQQAQAQNVTNNYQFAITIAAGQQSPQDIAAAINDFFQAALNDANSSVQSPVEA